MYICINWRTWARWGGGWRGGARSPPSPAPGLAVWGSRRGNNGVTGVSRLQETPTPIESSRVPRHRSTVGSYGGGVEMSEVPL